AAARETTLGAQLLRRYADDRRRDPREVPRARHPRAQHLHPRPAGLPALPAREPHTGARLRPPAGRHHAAQARADAIGDRGGRRVLRTQWHRADEGHAAPGHRPAAGLRDAVHQVPGARHHARRSGLRRPPGRGDRHRRAQDHRRDGVRGARDAQRPRPAAGGHARRATRGVPVADPVDRGALRPRHRRQPRRGDGQARVLAGLPPARRLVRRPAALV
ncbi:MAG: hypothetical protein AVDCRST_MAG38-446, partial [uncultured Solirubrobacteraceae bacterium]